MMSYHIVRLGIAVILLAMMTALAHAAQATQNINNPSNLTAKAVSESQIDLAWKDRSSNETSFRLWRAEQGQEFAVIVNLPPDTTSYSDRSVKAETTYNYKIEALVQSPFSATASATTPTASGGAGGGGGNVWTPITDDPSYKLVFDDEFGGSSLNTNKWYPPVNQRDNTYPNNGGTMQMLVANVSVHDGLLDLAVTKGPTLDGSQYGTSALTTKGNTISGQPIAVYFEARMKNMDDAYGLMSGYWTDTSPNYNFPESDFNEYWQAQSPNSTRQNYNDGSNWVLEAHKDVGYNLAAAYHVYGVHWTPQAMKFYIDGVETAKTTTNTNKTNSVFYAIVNASAGGGGVWPNGGTQLPNHVLFDYVHVYSAQAGAVAVTPDANYGGPGDDGTRVLVARGNKGEAFQGLRR